MLNCAYAMLGSQVRIAALAQGPDPTIGYLQSCRRGRVALVYDLMEPLRPRVDRLMLGFTGSHTFTSSDFALTTIHVKSAGSCISIQHYEIVLLRDILVASP